MNRLLVFALVFGIVGLVAGYVAFARVGGVQLSVMALVRMERGVADRLVRSALQIEQIRRQVLLSAATGAVAGIVLSLMGRRR